MPYVLLLLSFAAPALPQATITGWVREAGSREPIPFASVQVEGYRPVLTDEHGYFVIAGVEPGSRRVRAEMLGYVDADTTIVVPADGAMRLELMLEPAPVRLETIEVSAGADDIEAVSSPGPPPMRIDAPMLDLVPAMAEKDAFRAIQMLPSVAAASDFSSALYIRGGAPDQTLVLLDGAPLFNPYHLGGLFSAIDPDAISTLEVLPGAMPAAEGDRASGVVKVWTRDGGRDRVRGHGALGLVSSRLGIDGPLWTGSGSYLISARRTYFDLMTKAAYELGVLSTPFPYSFTDAHAKITQDIGFAGRLNVSGYINDERVHVPREVEPTSRTAFEWGTRAGSVAYRQPIGGSLLAEVTLAATSFDGDFEAMSERDAVTDTFFLGRITMRDLLASGSLTWYHADHEIEAGVQLDGYTFRYDLNLEEDVTGGIEEDIDDLFSTLGRTAGITTIAAYIEDEWTVSDAVAVRFGVRALHAPSLDTEWMPRVGLRWSLTERLALTVGAGRYAQAIHSLRDEESILASVIPYELLVPASRSTGFLVAEDVVAGLEYRADDTRVRMDAYYKRYPTLPTPPLTDDPLEAPIFATEFFPGTGWASGLEIYAQHRAGRARIIGSYALNWSERTLEPESYTPRYNRRHMLDLTAGWEWGDDSLLTARLAVGTGQPFTPAAGIFAGYLRNPDGGFRRVGPRIVLAPHNSDRLPGYLRLDVGARTEWVRHWFGRDVTLTPYVQVLNVLGNRNVTAGQPQYGFGAGEGGEIEFFPALPTLPTFGIEWRF